MFALMISNCKRRAWPEYSALVPWALSAAQGQELHLQKLEMPAAHLPNASAPSHRPFHYSRISQIMPKIVST